MGIEVAPDHVFRLPGWFLLAVLKQQGPFLLREGLVRQTAEPSSNKRFPAKVRRCQIDLEICWDNQKKWFLLRSQLVACCFANFQCRFFLYKNQFIWYVIIIMSKNVLGIINQTMCCLSTIVWQQFNKNHQPSTRSFNLFQPAFFDLFWPNFFGKSLRVLAAYHATARHRGRRGHPQVLHLEEHAPWVAKICQKPSIYRSIV